MQMGHPEGAGLHAGPAGTAGRVPEDDRPRPLVAMQGFCRAGRHAGRVSALPAHHGLIEPEEGRLDDPNARRGHAKNLLVLHDARHLARPAPAAEILLDDDAFHPAYLSPALHHVPR